MRFSTLQSSTPFETHLRSSAPFWVSAPIQRAVRPGRRTAPVGGRAGDPWRGAALRTEVAVMFVGGVR